MDLQWVVCVNILGKKNRRGSRGSFKLNTRSMKNGHFSTTSRFISNMVQDTATITMEDGRGISNTAIFNDLKRPL